MKIYQVVQKLLVGDRQTGDLISLLSFLESRLKIDLLLTLTLLFLLQTLLLCLMSSLEPMTGPYPEPTETNPLATSCLIGPYILLSTLFLNTLNLYFFHKAREQVLHSYKTTDVLIFRIFVLRWKDEKS
jgi:hypothetical protein